MPLPLPRAVFAAAADAAISSPMIFAAMLSRLIAFVPIAFDAFTDSPRCRFLSPLSLFFLHFSDTPPPPPLPPLFAAADFRHRLFTLFADADYCRHAAAASRRCHAARCYLLFIFQMLMLTRATAPAPFCLRCRFRHDVFSLRLISIISPILLAACMPLLTLLIQLLPPPPLPPPPLLPPCRHVTSPSPTLFRLLPAMPSAEFYAADADAAMPPPKIRFLAAFVFRFTAPVFAADTLRR
jgi:hypothetical protein